MDKISDLYFVMFFVTPEKKPKTRFSKPKTRFFKPKTSKSKPKTIKFIKKFSLHPYHARINPI